MGNENVCGLEDFGTGGRTRTWSTWHVYGPGYCRQMERMQPVGYILTSDSMCSDQLQSKVLTCIDKVQAPGLIVKVVIWDPGSRNRSVINSVAVSVDKPTFQLNHCTICVLYDPKHLL